MPYRVLLQRKDGSKLRPATIYHASTPKLGDIIAVPLLDYDNDQDNGGDRIELFTKAEVIEVKTVTPRAAYPNQIEYVVLQEC